MDALEVLKNVVGWVLTLFIGALGFILIWRIWKRDINLDKLVSEPTGDASVSRFQFLIFTFVIAMSLFFAVISSTPCRFPEIPSSILGLLGISGGSYVLSKGIQTNRDITLAKMNKGDGRPTEEKGKPSDVSANLVSASDAIKGL